MANHFNDLLLQTLKEVGIRLERLEGRVDQVINEKADKIDVQDLKVDIRAITEKLDQKANKADVNALGDEIRSQSERLDRDVNALGDEIRSQSERLDRDVNTLGDEVRSQAQRLDRIETGIKTLQWTMTAGLAILGIILAFVRSC